VRIAGYLSFKLDWLFGKNVRALGRGQMRDDLSGEFSQGPGVVSGENYGPDRISDHLPIYADINLSYVTFEAFNLRCIGALSQEKKLI